jgi:hypothetical protein
MGQITFPAPRQQLIDRGWWQVGASGSTPLELQLSVSEAMVAQFSLSTFAIWRRKKPCPSARDD